MTSPRPLHDRAIDNLRYIRETMERAGAFTAVPGWGQVAVGVTALAAALLAARQPSVELWLATWLGEAIVALVIGGGTMVPPAEDRKGPLLSPPRGNGSFSAFGLRKKVPPPVDLKSPRPEPTARD